MSLAIQERISSAKAELGERLCILGHHYQDDRVLVQADRRGDSLELARFIPDLSSEYIVFCGVKFMAESAAILARPGQEVFLPAPDADCVMAKTAPAALAGQVLDRLSSDGRRVIPLTYINSSAEIKALCGERGGGTCTSANAVKMLDWAMGQGDAVLFLPDKNLANNTADALGIGPEERLLLNITGQGAGIDPARARLFLWPGCCPVHMHFSSEHMDLARRAYPGIKIVVHPECRPEVAAAADAVGSTSFMIRYVQEAAAGSTIGVGTEINLVRRLAKRYAPDKTIVPLAESLCTNMAKVSPANLADLLDRIRHDPERAGAVRVDSEIADQARLALDRMLQACA